MLSVIANPEQVLATTYAGLMKKYQSVAEFLSDLEEPRRTEVEQLRTTIQQLDYPIPGM